MKKNFPEILLTTLLFVLTAFVPPLAHASDVKVDVTLSPAGSFVAETTKVKGSAYQTPNGIAAKNIEVDLNSLSTGIGLRDKHLKNHLEVSKYPVAKLSAAVGKNGQGKALIEIKGVKKQVAGTYKVDGNQLNAEFKIHLPDLGLTDMNYMGVGVEDDVTIHVTLPIVQRATASVAGKPGK
jgi:polyisoprenoid-binding protein YceI